MASISPSVVPNLMVTAGQLAFLDVRVKHIHQTGHRQPLDTNAAFCSLILPKDSMSVRSLIELVMSAAGTGGYGPGGLGEAAG